MQSQPLRTRPAWYWLPRRETSGRRLTQTGTPRKARGVLALEFALTSTFLLLVVCAVGEFYRLSLYDQALARATHLAARAAASNALNCENAARQAFAADALAAWLFDRDDDDKLTFSGQAGEEVEMTIAADDGDLANGVDFDQSLCGVGGSLLQVTAAVTVRSVYAIGKERFEVRREETSWAVNQL